MTKPITHHFVVVMLGAMLALVGAALAQPRKATPKITLELHEVVKEDAKAVERGAIRRVPVSAKVKLLRDDEELLEIRGLSLNVNLITKNTDGTSTNITEQMTMPGDRVLRLTLPMKKGVFAKSFVLRVKIFEGRKFIGETEKRGDF